jgi:hypothetical protein
MDEAVQPAPAGKGLHYERGRPEETTLCRLVQEHLETFLAQVELETGAGLPDFVKDEFDAFRMRYPSPRPSRVCVTPTAPTRSSSPVKHPSLD